jgi:hypothetical protein
MDFLFEALAPVCERFLAPTPISFLAPVLFGGPFRYKKNKERNPVLASYQREEIQGWGIMGAKGISQPHT